MSSVSAFSGNTVRVMQLVADPPRRPGELQHPIPVALERHGPIGIMLAAGGHDFLGQEDRAFPWPRVGTHGQIRIVVDRAREHLIHVDAVRADLGQLGELVHDDLAILRERPDRRRSSASGGPFAPKAFPSASPCSK